MNRNFHALLQNAVRVNYSELTSIKTGGYGYAFFPETLYDAVNLIRDLQSHNIYFRVFGNLSNIVISDKGLNFPSVITTKLNKFFINGEYLYAECGVKLPLISNAARDFSLSGLEFACSIPATLGGAIKNNAGAFGGEILNIAEEISILRNGRIITLNKNELKYSYRKFDCDLDMILSVVLKLNKGNFDDISKLMSLNKFKRLETQPHGLSAGSVFKKVNGISAGQIIDDCGLKFMRFKGAYVSPLHANFILNSNDAKSEDVYKLAQFIKRYVYCQKNILLEEEIEYIGDF